MAYPSIIQGGTCPSGYPKRTPSLFFETIWNTAAFKGIDGQFLLSMDDPTGYGYHGDFMNGLDDGVLQAAIDTCTNLSGNVEDCPVFNNRLNTQAQMQASTFPSPLRIEHENCAGPRQGLPGVNPIQGGPQRAIKAGHGVQKAISTLPPVASIASKPSVGASKPADPASTLASKCAATIRLVTGDIEWDECIVEDYTTTTVVVRPTEAAGRKERRRVQHKHINHEEKSITTWYASWMLYKDLVFHTKSPR